VPAPSNQKNIKKPRIEAPLARVQKSQMSVYEEHDAAERQRAQKSGPDRRRTIHGPHRHMDGDGDGNETLLAANQSACQKSR
jgi:hypothetical protein